MWTPSAPDTLTGSGSPCSSHATTGIGSDAASPPRRVAAINREIHALRNNVSRSMWPPPLRLYGLCVAPDGVSRGCATEGVRGSSRAGGGGRGVSRFHGARGRLPCPFLHGPEP